MKKHDPLKFFSLGTKPRVQAFPFQFLQGVGGGVEGGEGGGVHRPNASEARLHEITYGGCIERIIGRVLLQTVINCYLLNHFF